MVELEQFKIAECHPDGSFQTRYRTFLDLQDAHAWCKRNSFGGSSYFVADEAEKPTLMKPEMVAHPDHYNTGDIEVIDAIFDWGFSEGFAKGNVIKYVARAGKKPGTSELEDMKKARFYLEAYINHLENKDD